MDANLLSGIAGIVLSLAFSYLPGLKTWYGNLDSDYKRLVMGLLLVAVAGSVFGLSCGGIIDVGLTCDKAGILGAIQALIAALVANQGVFLLTPRRQ